LSKSLLPNNNPFNATAELHFLEDGTLLYRHFTSNGIMSKFLHPQDVASAFGSLAVDSGWIPENIIRTGRCVAGDWFVYYHEPEVRTITIDTSGMELPGLQPMMKITIPIPGTILMVIGKGYFMWALNGNRRPTPNSNLFELPLPNTDARIGSICFGSNEKPSNKVENAEATWKMFMDTPFNGHLASSKHKEYEQDIRPFLFKLAEEKATEYPTKELVSLKRTLDQMITMILERDM